MIYDCFLFFDEFDLLRLRLETLREHVDCFVLVEAPQTHSGIPKPLYFAERKAEFADFPIRHIVVDLAPYPDRLFAENAQRNAILQGLHDAAPDDIVLLSDLDEIPNLSTWSGAAGVFSCRMFYYWLNVLHLADWPGTTIQRFADLGVPQANRNLHWHMPRIGTGWHYSYIGDAQRVSNKVAAFCHAEYDLPEYHAKFGPNVAGRLDPFNRFPDAMPVVELEGPPWLLAHRAEYEHLIHPPVAPADLRTYAVKQAKTVPGLTAHEELDWLAGAALGCREIVEIGRWQGRTSKLFALAGAGRVHSIDNHSQSFVFGNDGSYVFGQALRNLDQQIKAGQILMHNAPSLQVATELRTQYGENWADLVFVDGDHQGLCPEHDIRAYWPLLKPGGILCGHDMHDEPVRRAVKKLLPDWRPGPGSLWFYRRRGETNELP